MGKWRAAVVGLCVVLAACSSKAAAPRPSTTTSPIPDLATADRAIAELVQQVQALQGQIAADEQAARTEAIGIESLRNQVETLQQSVNCLRSNDSSTIHIFVC